jgi:CBS domain-containing protein
MSIESLCTQHVVSLDGKEPLQRAAALMREHHVGAVVVTENVAGGVNVTGVVTDRDLAIEVLARGGDASQVPVSRLVQTPPVGISGLADMAQAVQAMQAAGVRRLLVHDDQGHLTGLLSIDDLIPALAAPLAGLAEVLRHGMQRETQARGALAVPARQVLRVPSMGTAGWPGGSIEGSAARSRG